MEQNEKDLLLKDLCSRLPYGVKLKCVSYKMTCIGPYKLDTIVLDRIFNENTEYVQFDEFKPYLFPMSSMTEEQKETYCQLQQKVIYNSKGPVTEDVMKYINWCYENHLDVNDLIPKGLAIDATGLSIY
jgi:hypothetical protein